MAEKSLMWTTGSTGDGATPYTQAEVFRWLRQWLLGDNTTEGVHKTYQNELEVTGTSTPIQIDTGAASVYGIPYWNTSAVNKTIATPSAATRYDRVVLQAGWAAQTVRIAVLTGTEGLGTPPAVTQSDGVTWEISLATLQVTTGGVITVTDTREYVHPNIAVDENMLDAAVAGDGLAGGDGSVLSVNVDDATIETNADTLRVKDAGIDSDALAASVAGDGLSGGAGSALSVNVDGSTIEIDTDTLRVKDLGITTAKLGTAAVDETKIATSVAGDGLTGGGGAALAVNPDNTTLEIATDILQVKDAGIGVDQIAAAIAGNGLDDGAGSALSVDPSDIDGWGLEDDLAGNLRIDLDDASYTSGLLLGSSGLRINSCNEYRQCQLLGAYNVTDSTVISWVNNERGLILPNGKHSKVIGSIYMPDHAWSSYDGYVYAVYCIGTGISSSKIYQRWQWTQGGGGTLYDQTRYTGSWAQDVNTLSTTDMIVVAGRTGPNPGNGTYLMITWERDATHASDTYNADIYFQCLIYRMTKRLPT